MLIILPPIARRQRSTKEEVVPIATLERGAQDQALPAALALAYQEGGDDLAVAGRALLLASFDAGVRAVLGLHGGEYAVALPVIRGVPAH